MIRRFFPAALLGAAALSLLPAHADDGIPLDTAYTQVDWSVNTPLTGEHVHLVINQDHSVTFAHWKGVENTMPLRTTLTAWESKFIDKLLDKHPGSTTKSTMAVFDALNGQDVSQYKINSAGVAEAELSVTFGDDDTDTLTYKGQADPSHAAVAKLTDLLNQVSKRLEQPTPPPTPPSASHFDKITFKLTMGMFPQGELVTVDGNTGDWTASRTGNFTGSAGVPAPKSGKLDGSNPNLPKLDSLQALFAKCDMASLQGVAISKMIPDGSEFTIDAGAGASNYTLSGYQVSIDPQYTDRVVPFVQALESIWGQAYPPIALPESSAAPQDSSSTPATQSHFVVANPAIPQGRQTLSGTMTLDSQGHEMVDGLKIENPKFASLLDTAGAQGKYLTVSGVVDADGIRLTSVQGTTTDSVSVLKSANPDSKTIASVQGNVTITGITGDFYKVRVTSDDGSTRTGYVPVSSVGIGGKFSPRTPEQPNTGITQALDGMNH